MTDTLIKNDSFEVQTPGRGTTEVTHHVARSVAASNVYDGICHVFIHHTSASLIITENADPDVQSDLERFLSRLAPDGDPIYAHTCEGPDDMPSHVRSVLTATTLTIPIHQGRLSLGTWQGIFLWEHRHASHRRRVTVCSMGHAQETPS